MEKLQKKVFLDLNHVFGSNFAQPMKNQIGLIEQDQQIKLVYTAGKTVVKKNIDSNYMEFIKLSDNIQSIECMAISPTKSHISICEKIKNQNFLLLNLYGLKTRDSEIKHFKLPQTQKQSSFKVIAFSPSQPKYVCCMTSQPDSQLMFLDISRSRGLAVSNFSVQGAESLTICPTQSHLISCAGKNIFRLFKVEDYSFKPYDQVKKLPKTRNFTAHAWFDKTKILTGTDRGELFMVGPVGNNFQVKRHFNNVFDFELIQEIGVSAICVFSNGFILGSNKGNFSLWIKQEQDQQNFQDEYTGDLVKKWNMPEGKISEVSSIAICPRQNNVAISFKNNDIAITSIQILMNTQDDTQDDGKGISVPDQVLTFLYGGFHVSSIDSMEICMHRPLLATLSKKQNSLRIWNYKKHNCELIKKFDAKVDGIEEVGATELINCLSFHPMGYYMAIGCCDKLRFYHLLESGLRNHREIVLRGVVQVQYSNGGQFLAAAYPRQKHNIHQINVYNSYTLEQIARLSDHSNLITDLCWKFDDKFLYSVGLDGTVAEWKFSENKQIKEWPCKKWTQSNSKYSSVMFEKTSRSVISSGFELNKPVVREVKSPENNKQQQVQKIYTMSFRINKMKFLKSQWNIPAIIAGTEDGSIKVFNSPFDNITEQTLNVHINGITHLQTSPCGRYVFSCGKDGLIFSYQVSLTNRQGYVNKRLHDQQGTDYELNPMIGVLDDELADIVLVQRNDVNEKIRYTKLLGRNLEDMKRRLIMQDDDQARKHENQLNLIAKEKDIKIEQLNCKFEKLKAEKKELEGYFQNNFVDTQVKNNKMFEDVQNLYEKKLAIQNKKYFELQRTYENQEKQHKQEIKKLNKKTSLTVELLKKQFADCFKKAQKVHTNQKDTMILSQKAFSEKVNQIQQEHESQLRKISKTIAQIEMQKSKKSAEYGNTIQSLKRQCKILNEQLMHYMSENEEQRNRYAQVVEKHNIVIASMDAKKKQLYDKQQNLKARQTKIGVFQQKISELQKKKHVLTYRTWQMRQEIEPKQDQIQFLKEQIFSLESEFQNLLVDQKAIEQLELKTKLQKQRLTKDVANQKSLTKEKKVKMKKICDDISNIVATKSSDKKLYEHQLKKLFEKYKSLMSEHRKNNRNMKGIEQMNRHMEHLDKQISQVNGRTDITVKKRDLEIQKATHENADLIKELTNFRQQKQQLTQQLKYAQKVTQSLKRQTSQLQTLTNKKNEASEKSEASGPSSYGKKKGSTNLINPNPSPMLLSTTQTTPSHTLARSNSQPNHKGKLVKGINYDVESLSIFSKAKIKELEGKLQMTKQIYRRREAIARIMRDKIVKHIQDGCNDHIMEKTLLQYEI